MSWVVLVLAMLLTIVALLGFAVSLVALLIQSSRHKPSRVWAVAAGASLVLVLLFGALSNAVSRQSGQTLTGEQVSGPNAVAQEDHEDQHATATVTRATRNR